MSKSSCVREFMTSRLQEEDKGNGTLRKPRGFLTRKSIIDMKVKEGQNALNPLLSQRRQLSSKG